jgi:hypothetical protein
MSIQSFISLRQNLPNLNAVKKKVDFMVQTPANEHMAPAVLTKF